jgi:hypothetical protein
MVLASHHEAGFDKKHTGIIASKRALPIIYRYHKYMPLLYRVLFFCQPPFADAGKTWLIIAALFSRIHASGPIMSQS